MRFSKTFLSGVAALALLAGPALAQPDHGGPDGGQPHGAPQGENHGGPQGGNHGAPQGGDHGGPQGGQHNGSGFFGLQGENHGAPQGGDHRPQGAEYHGGPQYRHGPSGPDGHWARGDHFNGARRVVPHDEWDRYHLHRPPPGYEWVNYNGQFLMIAISSGIIASIIAGSAY